MNAKAGNSSHPVVKRRRSRWLLIGLICFVALSIGGLTISLLAEWQRQSIKDDSAAAASAIRESKFDDALRLSQRVLRHRPTDQAAILIAARSAAATRDLPLAYSFCDQLPVAEKRYAAGKLLTLGKSLLESGQARRAEEVLRLTLYLNPEHLDATFVLAFILGAEGRAWEAVPLVRVLVEQNRFDVPQLKLVASPEDFFILQTRFVQECTSAVPDDPLPLLAVARDALFNNDSDAAEANLRRILAVDPAQIEAQVRWGRWLLEHQRDAEFRAWHQALPAAADEHPDAWNTRGLYALQQNQKPAAIRCFAEAARRDPNHRIAHFHLGQLLVEAGNPELAARFQKRSERLSEMSIPLLTFNRRLDEILLRRVAELCESLGRPREAVAWAELGLRKNMNSEWAVPFVEQIRARFSGPLPWITEEARLADSIEISRFPLPTWKEDSRHETSPSVTPKLDEGTEANSGQIKTGGEIRFSEEAASLGIDFRFYNDSVSVDNPLRMFEFTGGGLGVIDFDGDGWPDLYASQGSRFPREPDPPVHLDRLFRNRPEAHFDDVTLSSGLGDSQFSAGVTVGDFDQDGFPDLYLANIGPDRLYRNNGDGTFDDVTQAAGLQDDDWTTSCALADLNGDAFPDIYAVNYLTGAGVYTRSCESLGRVKSCLPTNFEPQQDRVWLNRGDGSFEEQTATALGHEQFAGRGLGLVVAGFDQPDLPDIFVANDTDPNFWQVNRSQHAGKRLQFDEQGIVSGLAFDGNGNAQASMGIAAGDADRDGRLDFFVTNFYREGSTLYLQRKELVFEDRTRAAGLFDSSRLMLGFGTQFLDADGDGWLDLIVANGHVYNNTHLGEPFKMPPQFFRNRGAANFVEVSGHQLGGYFEGKSLGRSLIRWDWNRDGWPDVAVSHLDAPLAVLTNQSERRFHWLTIVLKGVESNRDAIGSVVRVTAGANTWTSQVTAGDGYQASNDRGLMFGLHAAKVVDIVEITWPSGLRQTLRELTADAEYLIVEGREPHQQINAKTVER